jgi:hypothetical protein
MPSFDISSLTDEQRPTGLWMASLLQAIARDEVADRRTQPLTEPKLDTWSRFRGRLASVDLISLLFEDAAVLHRVPFDPAATGGPIRPERLPPSVADAWLEFVTSLPLGSSSADYVTEQARFLGLPTKMARSDLHVVKPHQKVLELPGTGGQLAHHLVTAQRDLTLQDNFVVVSSSWQERTLAGIVALELGAPHSDFALRFEVDELKDASLATCAICSDWRCSSWRTVAAPRRAFLSKPPCARFGVCRTSCNVLIQQDKIGCCKRATPGTVPAIAPTSASPAKPKPATALPRERRRPCKSAIERCASTASAATKTHSQARPIDVHPGWGQHPRCPPHRRHAQRH